MTRQNFCDEPIILNGIHAFRCSTYTYLISDLYTNPLRGVQWAYDNDLF